MLIFERLWSVPGPKQYLELAQEFEEVVKQKGVVLYMADGAKGVKKRKAKITGPVLLFTGKLPEAVLAQVKKAVTYPSPQLPFGQAGGQADPAGGSVGEEEEEEPVAGQNGVEGGREMRMEIKAWYVIYMQMCLGLLQVGGGADVIVGDDQWHGLYCIYKQLTKQRKFQHKRQLQKVIKLVYTYADR